MVPFYAQVEKTPEYVANTTAEVSTDNFYWVSRMIGAMADASYKKSVFHVERYQEKVLSKGHEIINHYDKLLEKETNAGKRMALKTEANNALSIGSGKCILHLSTQFKQNFIKCIGGFFFYHICHRIVCFCLKCHALSCVGFFFQQLIIMIDNLMSFRQHFLPNMWPIRQQKFLRIIFTG